MALRNTSEKFGSLTKFLHWTIFVLFIVQYFLVYRREYFPKDSPEKLQYILLHKSFGVCVLILALAMLLWRHFGTRPAMPNQMNAFEKMGAHVMHVLLYVSMLVMPITGMLMSMYGGRTVGFFGIYTLPNPLTKNEHLSDFFYTTHQWSSYVIIGLVSCHILAALYHHFIVKDRVLKRMLPLST